MYGLCVRLTGLSPVTILFNLLSAFHHFNFCKAALHTSSLKMGKIKEYMVLLQVFLRAMYVDETQLQ